MLGLVGALWLVIGCSDDVPLYAACLTSFDCSSLADGCFDVAIDDGAGGRVQAAFCSRDCRDDIDCPGGGACLTLEDAPVSLCYQRCVPGLSCELGFVCTEVEGDGIVDAVCLPG